MPSAKTLRNNRIVLFELIPDNSFTQTKRI
ncbi:hypothetical protein VPH209E381_0003 [Vibrio phage 209E38-1]